MIAVLTFLTFIVILIVLFVTGFLEVVVAGLIYLGSIALYVVFWLVVVVAILWILNEIFN